MEKKPRLRAPNFTNTDNMLLCDIINKYKEIIENKKTDGPTLIQKQKAWADVAKEFNSRSSNYTRTVESLQQNYKNFKKKSKKRSCSVKMDMPEEDSQQELHEYNINPLESQEYLNPLDSPEYLNPLESQEPVNRTENFKSLAFEKLQTTDLQKELLLLQIAEAKENLQHNQLLRTMEIEDAKKKYEHNDILRKLELERLMRD